MLATLTKNDPTLALPVVLPSPSLEDTRGKEAAAARIKCVKGGPALSIQQQRRLNDLELDQMDRTAEVLNTVIEEHAAQMDTPGRFDALLRLHHTEHGLPYLPR
jgi:hypothetical protein